MRPRARRLRLFDALLLLLLAGGVYACNYTYEVGSPISPAIYGMPGEVGWGAYVGGITAGDSDYDDCIPEGGGDPWPVWDGPLSYSWSASAGTFTNPDEEFTGWTAPQAPGPVTLTLTADDAAAYYDDTPASTTQVVDVMPRTWDGGCDLWGSADGPGQVQVNHEITLTATAGGDTDWWSSGAYPYDTYGSGEDTVTYTWIAPSGTLIGDIHSPTITWRAGAEPAEEVAITCRIDDEAVVPEGDEGSRDDPCYDATHTVTVWKIDSLRVRRSGSGNEFASTCVVAAGGKETDEHKADIQIRVWPAVEGVAVGPPVVASGQESGHSVPVSPPTSSVETDWEGKAYLTGEYQSSDYVRDVTLTLEGQTATVCQRWNGLYPWDQETYYFLYDVPLPVTFHPRLNDTPITPITAHLVNFLIKDVRVWHKSGTTYTHTTYYADPDIGVIFVPGNPELALATFDPKDRRPDLGGGTHTSDLKVRWTEDDIVDEVHFRGQDDETYSPAP